MAPYHGAAHNSVRGAVLLHGQSAHLRSDRPYDLARPRAALPALPLEPATSLSLKGENLSIFNLAEEPR
jgi:hypothetical protein